ncbi:MAG: prepilin peptidase [Nitrospiraceae bacterium]
MTFLMPYLVTFVFGAIIGSFLNVCIHRLPRRESIIWPGSHCPACSAPISPRDNVPIVSYLLLGGRCRACRARISPRYPLVELANAVGYVVILWRFGTGWTALAYALLFSALLVIACVDLAHMIVPDLITLPGIVLGFLLAATVLPVGLVNSLLGILVGGGLLWLLAWASPYLFGKEGMGGGDIKLLAMIGAFLGWKPTLLTVMIAAIVGSVVGLSLIACKAMQRNQYLPFGPFLALGAILAMLFHQEVLSWYFGLIAESP